MLSRHLAQIRWRREIWSTRHEAFSTSGRCSSAYIVPAVSIHRRPQASSRWCAHRIEPDPPVLFVPGVFSREKWPEGVRCAACAMFRQSV